MCVCWGELGEGGGGGGLLTGASAPRVAGVRRGDRNPLEYLQGGEEELKAPSPRDGSQ